MKRKVSNIIHGDQIRVHNDDSQCVRIQMNRSGFAYLDLMGIRNLIEKLEAAERSLLRNQVKQINSRTLKTNQEGDQLSLLDLCT